MIDEINIIRLIEKKIIKREEDTFVLDLAYLAEQDLEISKEFENHPLEFIETLKSHLKANFDFIGRVRLKNLNVEDEISEIRVKHLNSFVIIKGIINKITKPMAMVSSRTFECSMCGTIYKTKGHPPIKCKCGYNNRFRKISTELINIRELEVEELQENLDGKQPEKIRVRLTENLTDINLSQMLQAGSKIEILGVIQKIPLISKFKKDELFEYRVFALDINSLEESFGNETITEEDEIQIQEISVNNPLSKLSESLAPNIYGREEIKKAIVLQMLGGVKEIKSGGTNFRDKSHLLVVGSPGTGKSGIARNVALRMPKSYYVSGESASSVGLVASVEKDALTGEWFLRAGALSKANSSVLILDEMDKIKRQHLNALHTPMESGIVTIDKASIHATLSADCSILAISNPKEGLFEFTEDKTIVQQINLPSALLNRFDLIFVVDDVINESDDKKIADKIFKGQQEINLISIPLFRKFISYAKKFKPKILKPEQEELTNFYYDLRKKSITPNSKIKGMPVSVRHLEGMKRLCQASAKARLSEAVNKEDVEVVKKIFYESLIKLGLDEDGILDLARVGFGTTASKRTKISSTLETLKSIFAESVSISDKELREILKEKGMKYKDINECIYELNKDGTLLKKSNNWEWGI